ncbi:MAG: hypothetical protein WBG64_04855, partial [Thermoanaerobaculia bacterium]
TQAELPLSRAADSLGQRLAHAPELQACLEQIESHLGCGGLHCPLLGFNLQLAGLAPLLRRR